MKIMGRFLLLTLMLLLVCFSSLAQEASDITKECVIKTRVNQKEVKRMLDGRYASMFSSGTQSNAAINVQLPKGETAGFIYIKWWDKSVPIRVQVQKDEGYETIARLDTPYLCDYIPLPEGIAAFRILQDEGVRGRMYIAELRVFSRGDVPAYVQRWEPPFEKADLLVVSTHPDDELIFMGGVIPYYTVEKEKAVQVAYIVPAIPERRLELLDGLWHCGVRHYPDIGKFSDRFSAKMADIQKSWGKNRLETHIARLYRTYRPEVVVTHDIGGEYGHGAHKAVSDAAQKAIALAANSKYDKQSNEAFGVWQVKKLYLHLYENGQIKFDWRVPLSGFNGETALDIAQEAFLLHTSQQKGKYFVQDFGPYDNSLFGLFETTVGSDTGENDFFENIF